jgi:hypothetical protein
MLEALDAALDGWDSYYVIMGSSAAALTGLQFVVMTLLDGARQRGNQALSTADSGSVNAFGTPTIVHFGATLLLAAIVTAPWRSISGVRTALVLTGAGGLAYAAVVILRARLQTGYKPVLEDWLWHTVFPVVAYGGIVLGGWLLRRDIEDGLFVVGAMAVFLLFIGIHNAWDTVTYIAVGEMGSPAGAPRPPLPPQPHRRRGRRRR